MNTAKYRHNKNGTYKESTKGVCIHCLQHVTFRIIGIKVPNKATENLELVNHVACTRCLKSIRYNKKYKIIQHPIVKVTNFTIVEKLRQKLFRVKEFLLGNHVYGPFGRKRKK